MSEINEGLNLAYSNPANNFGSNNLRDLILVLHESGKNQETIYNVLNMIGVDKQRAYEAIECYIPKQTNTVIKMELKEKLEASKEVLNKLDSLSSEDDSLKKTVKELTENIDMLIGKEKAKSKKENAKIKVNSAPGALDPSSNLYPCPILDKLENKKIPSINKKTPNKTR